MSDTDIKDSGMFRMMGLVIGALCVLTLLIFLAARGLGDGEDESNPLVREALLDRIGPVARVVTTDDAPVAEAPLEVEPTAMAAMSGDEIVQANCAACHAAGVAGAPLLDDDAAWAERREAGLESLVASVINGKGAMPARAGTQLGDEELRSAVIALAGFEAEAPAEEAPAEEAPAEEAPAEAASADEAPADEAPADETAPAESPAQEADTSGEEAPAAETEAGTEASGAAADSEAGAEASDAAAETEAGTQASDAAADEASSADDGAEAAGDAADATAVAAAELTDNVKTTVDGLCAGCHISGVANAPKLGDKVAWDARMELGMDVLVASVINGKGAMPPRGGSQLSDEEIPAAIQYLISK